MGYTAMRGGLEAIARAEALLSELAEGAAPDLSAAQVRDHLRAAVDRAMSEGGLYDPDLGALAVRQADGDPHEAAFLLRAYRSTLPRLAYSEPADGAEMAVVRRISPAFQSAPGGQVLGRTRDYSQRLLDFELVEAREAPPLPEREGRAEDCSPSGDLPVKPGALPRAPSQGDKGHRAEAPAPPCSILKIAELLRAAGLLEEQPPADDTAPDDITREPLRFPASRSARLQTLARGETDAMTALAYSTMRGYGVVHSTLAELRVGFVPLRIRHPYTDRPVRVGEVEVTEVEDMTISRHSGATPEEAGWFGLGYGLVLGQNERKAIAMALLDRAIESGAEAPAADEEFVLHHVDGIEAAGFVEHLKLPHYVEFQAVIQRMRSIRNLVGATDGRQDADGHAPVPGREPAASSATVGPSAHGTDDAHARLHAMGIEHDH